MNLPEIHRCEDKAIDTIVTILNNAKFKFGLRQNLYQLAQSRDVFASKCKISLQSLKSPLAITSKKLVAEIIEKEWKLTPTLMYIVKYLGSSQDDTSQYYYHEALFSQPTVEYPIPQATASVYFRVEDKHIEPPEVSGAPKMYYRIEGHHTDHDVRNEFLSADRLLALIEMKLKLFARIEKIRLF